MAFGGSGVSSADGLVIFVPFTAAGDVVDVEIVERRRKFARGRLLGIVEPSPRRTEPLCRYFGMVRRLLLSADLSMIAQYPLIKESLPWMNDVLQHDTLFQFFYSFPLEIRKKYLLEQLPALPTEMYSSLLAIRKFLKRELVVYVKARKTSTISLVQFKQCLVALTVFDPTNEDVLLALKKQEIREDSPLHQNAVAEILFARLPKTIQGLLTRNPVSLIQKLSAKMSSLHLSPRQIINLMGFIQRDKSPDNLYKALNRIDGVAMKISITNEQRDKLHNYIESMKKNMDRAPSAYRTLFLGPELETYQKLYRPIRVMKEEETVTERIIRQYTQTISLDFYPTKDFFDLIKAKFSSDCTNTYLGEKQLMTPPFFNIRIFKEDRWVGNIYMLDFSEEHECLIIDRIQIPREMQALFNRFFNDLKDVLVEMLQDVRYRYILMPLTISNHDTAQKSFNAFKKKLSKKEKFFDTPWTDNFESLKTKKNYYVLHKTIGADAIPKFQ